MQPIPAQLEVSLPDTPALLITVAEAARLWSVSERHMRRMVAAGEVPSVRLTSRCVRIPLRYIEKKAREGKMRGGRPW